MSLDSVSPEKLELRKIKEKEFYDRIKNRTDLKKYGKLDYFNEMSSFVRGS